MAAGQLCQNPRPVLLLSCPVDLPHSAFTCIPRPSRGRSPKRLYLVSAEGNRDRNDREKRQQNNSTLFASSISFKTLAVQVLVVVGTLGFLDAGYSGDWSRIGVISPELESMLRLAAYGVVPMSFLLLWLVSKPSNQDS